jgi:hypothetical protein
MRFNTIGVLCFVGASAFLPACGLVIEPHYARTIERRDSEAADQGLPQLDASARDATAGEDRTVVAVDATAGEDHTVVTVDADDPVLDATRVDDVLTLPRDAARDSANGARDASQDAARDSSFSTNDGGAVTDAGLPGFGPCSAANTLCPTGSTCCVSASRCLPAWLHAATCSGGSSTCSGVRCGTDQLCCEGVAPSRCVPISSYLTSCPRRRCAVDGMLPDGCGVGRSCCGGFCADTARDPANCGACGRSCAAGQTCATGTCTRCVGDLATDPNVPSIKCCRPLALPPCETGMMCCVPLPFGP